MTRRFDGRDDEDDDELRARLARAPEPRPLSETLERLVEHLGAPPVSVLTRLREHWPDLVGPALAEHTRPIELVDGVLTIGCADGAMAAQLNWMEAQIRDRFDRLFGPGEMSGLRVRVDR